MEYVRRPPGRVPKALKRKTRKASKSVYASMLAEATKVVLRNRGNEWRNGQPEYVLFEFPYFVKFGEGFPKGHIVSRTALTNVHKVNAVKLLNWLHANGHSTYNARGLVQGTRQFEYFENSIDKMFDI